MPRRGPQSTPAPCRSAWPSRPRPAGGALGLEPYEEQLVAAAAMCRGRVAQMQTGEGKTLAASFAASFGALRGGGFLVVTANDYLARRDAEWMRPIYERLGLSVASISGRSSRSDRRDAYLADVCYLTARELGFDYLRDGLAYHKEDLVQRPFSAAIVDEADFVLIDEARVPLVIAGRTKGDGVDLREVDVFARSLTEGADYELDPEGRRVLLTLEGQTKLEAFACEDAQGGPQAEPEAQSEERLSLVKARLFAALHARRLLARDVDYVVKRGEVKLVDAFTGRVAERRQWPWGIQAALEAKEALEIGPEGKIFGSIAVQHLMALFPEIGGDDRDCRSRSRGVRLGLRHGDGRHPAGAAFRQDRPPRRRLLDERRQASSARHGDRE